MLLSLTLCFSYYTFHYNSRTGLCLLSAAIVFPVMFGDDPIDGTVYNLPSAWKVGYSYTIQIIGACVVFVAQIVLSCFKYGDERYV